MKTERIARLIGRQKMRLNYAYGTFAMFGWSLLIIDLFVRWFGVSKLQGIALIPIGFLGLWVIGYALDKMGFLKGEWTLAGEEMMQFDEIKTKLADIERGLNAGLSKRQA